MSQEVSRHTIPGEGLARLLSRSLLYRMVRHRKINDTTALVSQRQKHVKDLEPNRRHSEKVDRHQILHMILEEGSRKLRCD